MFSSCLTAATIICAAGLLPTDTTIDPTDPSREDEVTETQFAGTVAALRAIGLDLRGSSSARVAAGDLNGDTLIDYAYCDHTSGYIWLFENDGAGGLFLTNWIDDHVGSTDLGGVAIHDIDSDGYGDILVGKTSTNEIRVHTSLVAVTYVATTSIFTAVDPDIVQVIDFNAEPLILACDTRAGSTELVGFADDTGSPVILDMTNATTETTRRFVENTPTLLVRTEPCNNYTEPSCSVAPSGPGIAACMEAAGCRAAKCHWAACVNRQTRPWYSATPMWVAENLACGAVADLEYTGCLTEALPGFP